MRRHVQAHTHQANLRDLATAVRELLGAGYQVGSGSAHIWILRARNEAAAEGPERLAIIADRHTTAFRHWYEPKLPTGPRPSSRPEQRLSVPGSLLID